MGNLRVSASIALLSKAMPSRDARIIELGCGDGSLVMEVANALGIRDIYGVDINDSVLKSRR
jgi:methylase of polypeptide subunit release factors